MANQTSQRIFDFYPLEDRILLSGDGLEGADIAPDAEVVEALLAEVVEAEGESTDRAAVNATSDATNESDVADAPALDETSPIEIVFVDAGVEDADTLIDGIRGGDDQTQWVVVELAADQDGVEQITNTLSQFSEIAAVHLVSHGDGNGFQLGNTRLDVDTAIGYAGTIASWANALDPGADLLIYGCDLASTADGRTLIESIGALCGCDVAASDDATGHESLGGDWDLEFATGEIGTSIAFPLWHLEGWHHTLDISSDLEGHWEFNVDATDSSGNSRDGTFGGDAAIDTALPDVVVGAGSLLTDGSGDYVDLTSHASAFAGYSEGTIAAWVKFTATNSNLIFNIGVATGSSDYSSFFVNSGQLRFTSVTGGATDYYVSSTAAINDGAWHHVAVTVSNSGNTLYIDGVELTGAARTYSTGSATNNEFFDDLSSVGAASIAAFQPVSPGGVFNGNLDDVRLYDRALSASDIVELVNYSAPPDVANEIWFATISDVTSSDAPGLDAWNEDHVVTIGDPSLMLGDNTTGTLSATMDLAPFAADNSADIDAIHYVGRDITLGNTNTFSLLQGDVLVSTNQDETLGGVSVGQSDLAVFRPDNVGDYSSGTFYLLLDNVDGSDPSADLKDIALVEETIVYDGMTIDEGTFLYTSLLTTAGDVRHFTADEVGAGTTSGTKTTFIDGSDIGISPNIRGIELANRAVQIGGLTIETSNVILSLDANDSAVGNNTLSVQSYDIFSLAVSKAGGTTAADAIMLVDGSDLNLNTTSEIPYAIALPQNLAAGAPQTIVVDTADDYSSADARFGNTSSIATLIADKGTDNLITLREAIEAANNTLSTGPDQIHFNISTSDPGYVDPTPGSPGSGDEYWVIQPQSYLGDITDSVIIDATTQAGYAGQPVIELDGSHPSNTSATAAFALRTSDSGIRGFAVHSFVDDGIEIDGTITSGIADNNVIEHNWIGFDAEGNDGGVADDGILITDGASNNTIRNNVISNGGSEGILIRENLIAGTSDNAVYGNYIGTDISGTIGKGNAGYGIHILDSFNNTIGSSVLAERNVISGNNSGINVAGGLSTGNTVLGNYIGTDVTGSIDLGNANHGVVVSSSGNTIGGIGAGAGNVISGNTHLGITIYGMGASSNLVQGNLVGTNAAGTAAVANGSGLRLSVGATSNVIGGTTSGAGNVISGNSGGNNAGIEIIHAGTSGNTVQGNFIGTDITGTVALGNETTGITINSDASGNTIGGTAPGAGNVIADNRYGVQLYGNAFGNTVVGNTIGTDLSGTIDLGNSFHGVLIQIGAYDNTIGGTAAGAGNTIVNGGAYGIVLTPDAGTGNALLGNVVHSNVAMEIDLQPGGVTSNDALDADTGANNLQNFPVLTSANTDGAANVYVGGVLDAAANTTHRVEFFASTTQDSTGHGGAELYLGFVDVTTDGSGHADFQVALSSTVAAGSFITATATDASNNTSEFSANITAFDLGTLVVDTTNDVADGNTSSITALLNNRGADNRISLREAILATNATTNVGGPDEIRFEIPDALIGGVHMITVAASGLPGVTDAVVIDGSTESDYVAGTPVIVLHGAAHSGHGLELLGTSDGSTIRGLTINRFGSAGIRIYNSDGNTIVGNWIGTGVDGLTDQGNGTYGIEIDNSASNQIGGASLADRNVIAGNADGISLWNAGSTLNIIQGNYIGVDKTGNAALGNSGDGIIIGGGANNNTIGGDRTAGEGNVISGQTGTNSDGIEIDNAGADDNKIYGNYIGTNFDGTAAIGNARYGVVIYNGVAGTEIGGTGTGQGNIISGNSSNGVHIDGNGLASTTLNIIAGNFIGTDVTGTIDLGNAAHGIEITAGAIGNTIGGTTAADRNVIAGNQGQGIEIFGNTTTGTLIQGNYIGTDATGTTGLRNEGNGIRLNSNANTTVGGSALGAGNVISGNDNSGTSADGIYITGGSGHTIQGNTIGLGSDGTTSLGNDSAGVAINSSSGNQIGGTAAGARNVISANEIGVRVTGIGSTGNAILGNYIGTDSTGMLDRGNTADGIELASGANGNTIGGITAAHRNIISGNDNDGIWITGSGTDVNIVLGNWIGLDAAQGALGNSYHGIAIENAAGDNLVGGTLGGAANKIANNAWDGVAVVGSGTGNSILGNEIYENTWNGIDLGNNGTTTNDGNDTDPGPNDLQNFPVVTQADLNGSNLTVSGSLDTDGSNTDYRIEFFGIGSGDAEGYGEARSYLGATTVTTDGSGDATFSSIVLSGVTIAGGDFVTATATQVDNQAQVGIDDLLAYGSTSEFAQNAVVSQVSSNTAPYFGLGGNGSVTTTVPGSTQAIGYASLIQNDGKIVVAGMSQFTDYDVTVVRYHAGGAIDTSFGGGDGIVTLDIGAHEFGFDIAQQADGKLVVVGYTNVGATPDLLVVRLHDDGTLDNTFDGDGWLTTDFGGSDYATAVTVQADGKIVVAGNSGNGGNNFAIVRYNNDGSLDTTFDTDGRVDLDFATSLDQATSVALQADGRIVVGGLSDNQFALARLTTSGSLDTTFDTDGLVTTDFGVGNEAINALAIQADGKIIAGGTANFDFALARYNTDGSLDTTFDVDGMQTFDAGATEQAYDLALTATEQVVIAGNTSASGDPDVMVQRYNSDGSLDTSFGSGGTVITVAGGASELTQGVNLLPGGRILTAGYQTPSGGLLLRSYDSGGSSDNGFGATSNLLDGNPTFVEGSSPVVLDSDVAILDAELSGADNFNGASLTLVRNGGASADDVFSATGTLTSLTESDDLEVDGVVIGEVNINSGGTLNLIFHSNATNDLVNSALRQIAYSNTSDDPPASVQIDWIFDDGNAGGQGSGGAMQANGSTTVNITAVNDAPNFSSTNSTPTWTENGGPVGLFSGTSIDPLESGDLIQTLTISVSGLADGSDEVLVVDGQAIELTHLNGETTATGSYEVDVSVSGSDATVTINKTGGYTVAAAEALVNGLAYNSTSEAPQGAVRLVTLTSIQDDGGTAYGGDDTTNYGLASLVNIQPVNDAPVLDNSGAMTLVGISEDDIAGAGQTVASIIASAGGDRITDVDASTLEGIAITARDNTNGTWQYSIDAGSNWLNVGLVSDSAARVLRDIDLVRFNPDGNNGVSTSITFRAWDQTSDSAGSLVDTTTNGGTTAFSSSTESATIVVTAINDDPIADAGGPYAILEGDVVTLNASGSSDIDRDSLTYRWDLDNDSAYDDLVTTSAISVVSWATLQAAGIDDNGTYTIGLEVDDGNGGVVTDSTNIIVANRAPTLTITAPGTITEGVNETYTLSASDFGDDTIVEWTVNWGDGNVDTYVGNPSSATHTYEVGGHTYNILVSARDEDGTHHQNELLLASSGSDEVFRFAPTTGDFVNSFGAGDSIDHPLDMIVGPDGLLYVSGYLSDDIQVFDPVSGAYVDTIISGVSVFDGPTGMAFGAGGDLFISAYDANKIFRYDFVTTNLTEFVSALPAGSNGPEGLAFGPDGNLYVVDYDFGNILKYDGTSGEYLGIFVAGGGLNWAEEIVFGPDGDLFVANYSTNQVLRFDGATGVSEGVFASHASLIGPVGIDFGPDGHLYVSGYDSNNVVRFDRDTGAYIDEYVASGNGLTNAYYLEFLPQAQATVVDANDAPTISSIGNQVINEDTAMGTIAFTIDDEETAPNSLIVTATSNNQTIIPDGNITLGGSGSNRSIEITPASNQFGGPVAITVTIDDGTDSTQEVFTIDVMPVNDAPTVSVIAAGPPAYTENSGGTFVDASGTVSDVDSADFDTGTLTLSVTNGTASDRLEIQPNGVGPGQVSLSGSDIIIDSQTIGSYSGGVGATSPLVIAFNADADAGDVQAVLRRIIFSNVSDAPDTTNRNIEIVLTDGDGGTSTTATRVMGINAINDDPTNAGGLPSDVVVTEDVASDVDLSAIHLSDLDAAGGSLTLTVSTSSGGNLAATSGGGVIVGGSGTSTLTLSGTLANLNTFLDTTANVTYQHGTANTFGNDVDTMAVVINDGGNTGSGGGGDITLGNVNVDITAVNDSPGVTGTLSATVTEGGTVTITDAMLGETDPDDAGVGLTYTLTSGPSHGRLELTTSPGNPITSFTQDDLDSGRVIYVHDDSENMSDSFDFSLTDGGEDGSAPASDTFNVNITPVNDNTLSAISDIDLTLDSVTENVTVGTTVGITAFAEDLDAGDTVTYSLTSNPAGLFQINANTGVVTTAAAIDRELHGAVRTITVQAQSSDGSIQTQNFNITINDLDEFDVTVPVDSDGAVDEVDENVGIGTTVGITASAFDNDASNNTVTYSLISNPDGLFQIDSATGVVTSAAAIDREVHGALRSITVQAHSSDGSTQTRNFNITINDLDEFDVGPITDSDLAVDEVAENAGIGSTVGITALANDADATTSAITYSLDDDASGRFAIDAVTGEITVNAALDYETNASHSVVVQATSADGSVNTQSFTITVTDVSEFGATPIVDNDATPDWVTENAGIGTTIGVTASSDDADGTDSITYSLDDEDGGRFTIDSSTGVVTVNGAIDREADGPSRSITVRATSTDGSFQTRIFSISIEDADEFDVGAISDVDGTADQISENAAIGTAVGITASATDADATTNIITYSLLDDDGGRFTIDPNSGIVTVAGSIDREADGSSRSITLRATSSDGSFTDQGFTISILDVDEFDVGAVADDDLAVNEVDENASIGTAVGIAASASDADATTNAITYSLQDDDGGRFAINSASGIVTVNGAIDREADGPTRNISVRATSADGSFTDQVFSININDVDEFDVGANTDADVAVNVVDENAASGTTVGVTALASDADATNNSITYSLDDDAGGRFTIDSITGVVTVADGTLLDRESAASHNITVQATSVDGSSSTQVMSINLNDVDEFDVGPISDSDVSGNSVDENAANGTIVGVTALAADADATNNTITYSLDDSAGGRFAIDGSTGVVTVADGTQLNREAAATHEITVRATSSDGSTSTQTMTININDVDEFDVGPIAEVDAAVNQVAENAVIGSPVGITAFASDADATTNSISYTLLDDDGGRFTIDGATGIVTVAGAIDREADGPTRNITVRATSADASFTDQVFGINITDVDEFDASATTDTDAAPNNVNENAAVGTNVGITASATDLDATNNTITYSLDDNDGGRFSIDPNTGVVTVAGAIDREADGPTRSITVRSTGSDGSSTTQSFTVNINDIDEFNTSATVDTDGVTNAVDENSAVGTSVGITASASDADATSNLITYSLDDNDGGRFAIDSASGVVTVAAAIDRETDGAIRNITVRSTSSDGSSTTAVFTIAVNDIDEFDATTPIDTDAAANSVNENSALGTYVGITAFAVDADATDNISYTLDDSAGGRFAIDSTSGLITVSGSLDFETSASHNITVRATSTDGSIATQVMTVNIDNVNEAPVAADDNSYSALAGTAVTLDTPSPLDNDSDVDGDALLIQVVSGPTGGTLSVDAFGNLVYTPTAGFVGTDTIVYRADDGSLTSNPAVISIDVIVGISGGGSDPTPDPAPETEPEPAPDDGEPSEQESESEEESSDRETEPAATAGSAQDSSETKSAVVKATHHSGDASAGTTEKLDTQADAVREFMLFSQSRESQVNLQRSLELEMFERLLQLDLEQAIIWHQWDQTRGQEQATTSFYVGTAGLAAGLFSVGYVFWALRGGAFAAAITSTLPSWRLVDPAGLLAAYRTSKPKSVDRVERMLDSF